MKDDTSLLSAENLSACWDKTEVIHSVNTSFSEGEFICVLGPNGSGKSTFLTLLSGLTLPSLKITEGTCRLNGTETEAFSSRERARLITLLPQNESYTWNYSVLEAVRMGRYAQSNGLLSYSEEDNRAAQEALEMAEIAHLADRHIFELSGGELQSVLIARSLAQNTPAMILDEPFTFLDAGKSDRLLHLLHDISRKQNKCIIISMHDINSAPRFADRILLFSKGSLLADGKVSTVFTAENMEKAYGTPFSLYTHPVYGIPQVCPDER